MNTAPVVDPSLPRRRIDVHDYHRMAEAGILTDADRVELIDGEIIVMPPVGGPHVDLVNVLNTRLVIAFGRRATVSVQHPLRLSDLTESEPDLVVLVPGRRRTVPMAAEALLVIEVAESSLRYDRDTKLPRFALSGIPETWLIDVAGETLTRHVNPGRGGYGDSDVPDLSVPMSPRAMPDIAIDLDGLFRD